ncbi:MAG TPA: lipoprotein [Steroidobacteraceae bacterium]|nr:lipoprotein [Steroidobacteraceae bacterium]
MLRWPKFLLFACIALTTAACGLKGPLYRADEPRGASVPPSSESAGSSGTRKKDTTAPTAPGQQTEPPVSPPDPDRPVVPPDR